jgi:hypothetical protein
MELNKYIHIWMSNVEVALTKIQWNRIQYVKQYVNIVKVTSVPLLK